MGDFADLRDSAQQLDDGPSANLNLRFGVESSPDEAAETARLARRYKLPAGVVSEFREDYRQKAKVEDARIAVEQSPKLRGWLAADINHARMAHDDVETLGGLEAVLGSLGKAARYVASADDGRGLLTDTARAARAIAAGAVPQFNAAAWGAVAYPAEAIGLDGLGAWFREKQREQAVVADRLAGADPNAGLIERGIFSGLRSAGQQLPTLGLGAAKAGGEALMLGAMGVLSFGQSYGKARDQGASVARAGFYGLEDATAEVVTEKYLGAAKLLGDAKAGMGMAKLFIRDIAREIPGEMGATLWQNFNEWANLNPEKTVAEWLAEQPAALAETVVATIVGGGVQVGAIRGAQKVMGDGARQQAIAQRAEQVASALEQAGQLAAVSKLNARDATSFKALIADITEEQGDAPTELFIDGATLLNMLNQSGISRAELEAVAPVVASQLDAARAGSDVRVPVSEFLSAGDGFTAPLVDHLRAGDDAMTRAEAREFLSTQGDKIKADVEQELQKRDDQATFRQSIEGVRTQFEAELNAAKRFTPAVNKAYSELLANFYGATASRLGMTPEALLEKYKLRVQAQSVAGERTLNQVDTATPEFANWFGDSKVVGADGKPLVVYHGTSSTFNAFDSGSIGANYGADERGFFFTSDPARASAHSKDAELSTSNADANVMPVFLSIENPWIIDVAGDPTKWFDAHTESAWVAADEISADGLIIRGKGGATTYVVERPEQIKSATGNRGTFDPNDPNILNQGEDTPRAQIAFADDITTSPSVISLLAGADLSSFIHESGHFFLEVQSDLAARIQQQIDSGASVTPAERGIVEDMNRLLEWFGIKGNESLSALAEWSTMTLDEKREHHEAFARGFERYTMEGVAPSIELQGIFSRFRSWLVQIYKTLRSLNVELTNDVRAVMGRMLATDFAIEEAEAQRSMGPLFKDAETAGMTLDEFNALQSLGQAAKDNAISELQTRGMKDMKWLSRAKDKALKARQMEVDDLRRDIRAEVTREVMAEPVYQAWQTLTGKAPKPVTVSAEEAASRQARAEWKQRRAEAEEAAAQAARAELLAQNPDVKGLQKGQLLAKNKRQLGIDVQQRMLAWDQANPEPALVRTEAEVEPGTIGKLHAATVKALFPAQEAALASKKMLGKEGADPEIAADVFGFDSGDAMVKALAAAAPPQEVIDARTDERMLEMFGDITSQEALQKAADEAVHNELRARVIAAEMKALESAGRVREQAGLNTKGQRRTVDVMARAAKEAAQNIIARLKVRELRPSQYAAAEARNAKLAEKAFKAAQMPEAALHKRNQLVNNYATRLAYDAQEEVAKAQRYFRKFDKRSKAIDAGYQDQIEQMLERFDFRPASLREIDRRKSFAVWVEEQRVDGIEPSVPAELLDEANRKSYRDMTIEEIRGLRETIEQIEHLGRLKNRLLLARDQKDFDAAASEMAASIIEFGGKARPVELEGQNPVVDWFAGVRAQHRKLSSLFREMDGNKDSGPMYDLIGRAMNERGTMEDVMVEKATVALRDIYAPIMRLKGGTAGGKLYIPEIGASLSRGGRLSVALNWGNEANRQRIMDGDKWSEGQVRAILKTLTPVELKFVNDIWAYLDSFWPEIAAKEKRLTGVEPEKVEALPFNVTAADGTDVEMRGGYYPLKYDTDRSDRADQQEAAQAAKEMMQGVFTRATTRRGHTKARLEEVKRAVRKDLNVITQHVTQVTHDLAWHEWLIDTNKLLGDDRVSGAIRDHYGPKVLKTMRDAVMGIATADVAPQTDIDKALLLLRSNVTRATMGASLTTAFLQPFGLTQSMVRIGAKHVLRGVARWGGDAARMENSVAWIREKSEFMRLRAKTFNRELREIRGAVSGKSKAMRVVDAGLFALMQKMQLVADVPTWIGQYEKSLSEGLDEAAAVAMADRAVLESQGGGQTKDLAEVQRKHPMLTQFYSYFSVTMNLAAESTAATNFKNPAAVAGWLGDMALLMIIPAILPSFIMYALKGGGDDDDKSMARRLAEWQLGYLLGTVVGLREFSGAVSGFDYAGPPVSRIVVDISKATQQTAQGELDEAAIRAYANLMGSAFGIPVTQAMRSYRGWKAWDEGEEGAGPQSILFGPPPKD